MSMEKDCNTLLADVMEQVGTPDKFLDEVFDYLNMDTSFFQEISEDNQFGLLPGKAKQMVEECFNKHQKNKKQSAFVLKENIEAEKRKEKISKMKQEDFQADQESHNGAQREKYAWSQSVSEITVKFHLPSYIRKVKQVRVEYDDQHLKIEIQNKDPSQPMVKFIDADFKQEINASKDSITFWSVEKGAINVSYLNIRSYTIYFTL